MSRLPGRLGSLTAQDVMTREVITLQEGATVEVAITTLRENHVTGASGH